MLDIVPNHCSASHPWFQAAVADPDGPYRDYFLWRDPTEDGGLPNNWVGYFGGPAWTLDEASGQYYLHLFLSEQPDLNWRNPDVRREFREILRFWLDRGVDGFRIDVAQAMAKDIDLRSNPQRLDWDPAAPRWAQWHAFDHVHDVLQPESLEIFAEWREITDEYGAVLIGETYVLEPAELAGLLPGDGLDIGFWFKPMHIDWDAKQLRAAIDAPLQAVADPRMIGWVASSHDEMRPPSRFGGGDAGRARSLAFTTLLLGLPGLPFLYQGEELALVDGIVADHQRADPVGADVSLSRDGCRTPMPWEPGPSFGFSASTDTWLPDGGRTDDDTASAQRADPDSWFHRYRRLIEVRRREPALRDGSLDWVEADEHVLAYTRDGVVVAANVGDEPVAINAVGEVLYSTHRRLEAGDMVSLVTLEPAEAIMVRGSWVDDDGTD